jgi:segregation and condensation protein A
MTANPASDQNCAGPIPFAWDDSLRIAPASNASRTAPILSVDGFEGPLDWLLEMARAQKIDLARLSIAALIDCFATALEAALTRTDGQTIQLERWGDWLVMAATLALLRSRLLLSADAPEILAAARDAEALRRQVVSRAQMAAAADWLTRRPQLGRDVFARGMAEARGSGRVGDITELLRACLLVLRVPAQHAAAYRPLPPPLWKVIDAIARLTKLLSVLPDGSPLDAFLPEIGGEASSRKLRCRAAVVSTLLAGLEQARSGALVLEQEEAWAPIHVQVCRPERADG